MVDLIIQGYLLYILCKQGMLRLMSKVASAYPPNSTIYKINVFVYGAIAYVILTEGDSSFDDDCVSFLWRIWRDSDAVYHHLVRGFACNNGK